ncbi:MAG TPA: DUF1573 domain-containing protein [Ferruginibacter sp.]|jgi:hypothetical protein|nr:DUF1573 domain-containing protein [Ferruginibacter sp.]
MKKFLLIISISILFFSCDMHRRNKIADDAGVLMEQELKDSTSVQVPQTSYTFDTATEGQKIEHNFSFTNSGDKPLIIIKATASCGCTIADKPEQPILPGDTGSIRVIFNSAGKRGHNHKTITVESNAYPSFPQLILTGEIKEAIKK